MQKHTIRISVLRKPKSTGKNGDPKNDFLKKKIEKSAKNINLLQRNLNSFVLIYPNLYRTRPIISKC